VCSSAARPNVLSGTKFVVTPVRGGKRPVSSCAREGVHSGNVCMSFSVMPPAARASMATVSFTSGLLWPTSAQP
jgi:hypothetical protein